MVATTIERPRATTQQRKYVDKRKQELRDAAERVYRKYGNDLTAFRKDIQKELEKREG